MESWRDRHPGLGPGSPFLLLAFAGACASIPVGDPARGREVFVSREGGHCVLCHQVAGAGTSGNVGPALDGIGARLTVAELRLRVADITKVYPDSVMPTFHRTEGMKRVARSHEGKPVLDAQQVEDVVAWLATLR